MPARRSTSYHEDRRDDAHDTARIRETLKTSCSRRRNSLDRVFNGVAVRVGNRVGRHLVPLDSSDGTHVPTGQHPRDQMPFDDFQEAIFEAWGVNRDTNRLALTRQKRGRGSHIRCQSRRLRSFRQGVMALLGVSPIERNDAEKRLTACVTLSETTVVRNNKGSGVVIRLQSIHLCILVRRL